MSWFTSLFQRKRRYDDLSVSIQEHIHERVDELMQEGMTRQDAEREARRAFGNVALIEERGREAWQWVAFESLLRDLTLVFRRLRKTPGFAITVLLTLAIGIGANTAVFSVVNGILLKPLPYPDSDRLVALWLDAPGAGGLANFMNGLQLSTSMYLTFSDHNRSFEAMGIWNRNTANVTGLAEPEQVRTILVSGGVLEALDVPAAAGRWFSATDQDPHSTKTVMLSYGYWQRHFGGDRSVIGRTIQVDSQSREIVGVMPRGFRVEDRDFDLILPLQLDRAKQILAGFGWFGIGRLKPGVSIAQADSDIKSLIGVWMDSWSNGPGTNPHYYKIWRITPNFRSLKKQVIGNIGNVLWVVMATVGLVMLIACTNVANLLLVRAEARHQELSVRAALGASRGRIIRELMIESVTLGMMGGVLGVFVAYAGLRLLVQIGPVDLPRLSELSLDGWSLLFTFLLSVFSGVLFGAIPAIKYAWSKHALMMGGATRTTSAGRPRQRMRNLLVVAQVAMALVLLVCALLMIRTFAALRNVEPGFSDPAHVQLVSISIPDLLVPDQVAVMHLQNSIADKIAGIPGVTSVGFASAVPMDGDDPNWDELAVDGKVYESGEPPLRLFNYVSPGYFRAMGTRLVAGRDFSWSDLYALHPVVIVSENFARDSWGSAAAAIGKSVHQFSKSPRLEVVGVVEDVRQHGVDEKAPMIIYWPAMITNPYTRTPTIYGVRGVTFTIRSNRAGMENFLTQVQQAVWSVNGSLPLAGIQTMDDLTSQAMARTSFTLVMLSIAGSMALLLGIIGIYGIISYAVSQRTREIGIRLALGARKRELRWMFVRSALVLTATGVVFGLAAAIALTRLMKTLLFEVSPTDPVTYVTIPLILTIAAMAASYLPARRAASIDPVEALRAE
ncbi:ADOP family duplicated permease [Acidicapsa dinghuensis]|uniref:ADOP family duplicated permease n=1 Tax=Acidicapsa dinghuensis TaxID=2218256 RepID=A0ABW1EKL8_9BACT|nr:ABC transporter permease [Acidicapsa dinghuensis]